YEELQDRIVSSVRVTDDEVKREFLKQNQKVTVNYIFYDLQKYANPKQEITEDSIENYYKSHSDEFQEEEKRKIQYVVFPKTATPQDSAAKWELARSLVERAKEGEDFADLAEIYSEDPGSRDKGGELGFFSRGSMVKPFEEAAFAAKVGEVVGPVQSNFGLHVIKVEDKKIEKGQEQVKASHILIKFGASRNTIERARDDANYFIEDAKEKSFEQLAQENKLQIDTTNFFPKGSGFVPGIGLNKKASNFIFNNDAGRIGDVVETPQGFIVYKIAEIQKRRTKPLETVKSIIQNKLLLQKRLALAAEKAQQAYDQIQNGLSFREAARLDSLKVTKTEPFSRTDFVPNVGRDAGFIGAAFSLNNPNDVTKPVKGTRGYYLIQLVEKTETDSTAFETQKASLAQQLLQRKRTQVYAAWYEALKAKADIKDYRDRFF
ncbi:MAG: peptidylprolyl isomerase, partial [bacterium]